MLRELGHRAGLTLAISIGLLLNTIPANGEFLSAQLSVNGLSCPFCVFGIEKKLLDVPGVLEVEVFLDEGRIALAFERGSEATVKALEQAVRKGGFELAGLSVETTGEITRDLHGSVRLLAHPGMVFRLTEIIDGREQPVSTETLRRIKEARKSDAKTVVIEGTVLERDSPEPLLVIRQREAATGPTD